MTTAAGAGPGERTPRPSRAQPPDPASRPSAPTQPVSPHAHSATRRPAHRGRGWPWAPAVSQVWAPQHWGMAAATTRRRAQRA